MPNLMNIIVINDMAITSLPPFGCGVQNSVMPGRIGSGWGYVFSWAVAAMVIASVVMMVNVFRISVVF